MALDPGRLPGDNNSCLQATEYWTSQCDSVSTETSWWTQTNWFNDTPKEDRTAKASAEQSDECAGNARVFNRFVTKQTTQTNEKEAQRVLRKRKLMTLPGIGGFKKQVMNNVTDNIVLPLQHPELFKAIGVPPSTGVIISGAPGSGKTALLESMRKELNVHFQKVDGAELLSAGDGPKRLTELFKAAVKEAPSLVFIDQIESIAREREANESSNLTSLRAALRLMMDALAKRSKDTFFGNDNEDGHQNRANVVVVGATLSPTLLCPSLMRQGRFDKHVELTKPDLPGRLALLNLLGKGMKLDDSVDLEQIAESTVGYVGADLEALCSEAGLEAIRRQVIRRADMEDVMADGSQVRYTDKLDIPRELPEGTCEGLFINQADFLAAVERNDLRAAGRQDACSIPKVTWDDVGGLKKVKKALIETLEYPLQYPNLFKKFGMSAARGVLLYGPPGCGKTLVAEAVAKECRAHFIVVNSSALLSPYFGKSEQNVRDLFTRARANAPCVLFFDELDSLARARGSKSDSTCERIVTQLLCEMDGVDGNNKDGADGAVFVVGATNRPDLLDPALIRPGRLDHLVLVGLPSLSARVGIFKALMRETPLAPTITANDDEFLHKLAGTMKGCTGADIAVVCNRARKYAITRCLKRAQQGEGRAPMEEGEGEIDEEVTEFDLQRSAENLKPSVDEQSLNLYRAFKANQSGGAKKTTKAANPTPTPAPPAGAVPVDQATAEAMAKGESVVEEAPENSDYDKRAADAIRSMMATLSKK